ncbi:MAG TPA: hypothetical protein VH988_08610 [Thermoanaerobaculia bacterium]|jgi:hypothetical protein|nr:hypothetical protein [Thermoanaerobaculia bacterium]
MNEPNEPSTPAPPDTLRDQLLALAAETRPVNPLPSAERLLWKAEIRRRLAEQQEKEEKAARPAVWGWTVGLLAGATTVLFVLSLHLAESAAGANAPPLPAAVWLASLVIAPVAAIVTMGWLRRRVA